MGSTLAEAGLASLGASKATEWVAGASGAGYTLHPLELIALEVSMYSGHPGTPRRRASAALGLAALLAAAGSSAFATTGDMTQAGSKSPAPSATAGRLSSDVVAKVLKVEKNLSKLGPRDTRLDMARALSGTDDSFGQWQAQLESDADSAGAKTLSQAHRFVRRLRAL